MEQIDLYRVEDNERDDIDGSRSLSHSLPVDYDLRNDCAVPDVLLVGGVVVGAVVAVVLAVGILIGILGYGR